MTAIAIKYVNPAKEGKKFGSLKDNDGNVYYVPKEMVGQFQPNTTVDVPLSPQNWGGKVVQVVAGHANANAAQPDHSAPAPLPPTQYAPPRPAYNGNGVKNDVLLTTIALMKSFIEAGSFGLTDLPALEAACLQTARSLVKRATEGMS